LDPKKPAKLKALVRRKAQATATSLHLQEAARKQAFMEDVEALAVRPVLPRLEDGAGQDVDTEKPTKKEESSDGDREEEPVADDDAVDGLVRA